MRRRTFAGIISAAFMLVMLLTMATGCGANGPQAPAASGTDTTAAGDKKIKLTFAISDNNQLTQMEAKDMPGQFKQAQPNIDIEIEKIKDAGEYENVLKVRAASRQMPDLVVSKPYMLRRFKNNLVDLSDTAVSKKCSGATAYAVDGKILGIPEKQSREFVYYWKSMFAKAGIEVPTTWDDFVAACVKLKSADPRVMPIALGAKDEWPDYPFNEYMPALETGDGFIWSTMATEDNPFEAGKPFNLAYHKIQKLYDEQVFGPDPIGIGNDQAVSLFSQKQAAMHVSGAWALVNIKNGAGDVSDLGAFFLPTRNTTSDPFRTITQADNFLGVSVDCKYPEEAKAFIDWYFGDWYNFYVTTIDDLPSIDGVEKKLDPVLQLAADAQPDAELVMYDGGSDDFNSIITETKFDYKKLGVEMMTPDFDLDKRLQELGASWAAAREKLGLK